MLSEPRPLLVDHRPPQNDKICGLPVCGSTRERLYLRLCDVTCLAHDYPKPVDRLEPSATLILQICVGSGRRHSGTTMQRSCGVRTTWLRHPPQYRKIFHLLSMDNEVGFGSVYWFGPKSPVNTATLSFLFGLRYGQLVFCCFSRPQRKKKFTLSQEVVPLVTPLSTALAGLVAAHPSFSRVVTLVPQDCPRMLRRTSSGAEFTI
ncbi:hypothetical protein KM043_016617 [Ampulex compressa]|nr:hypothetical protein KM043_016617 [Ampulex compressa]